MKHPYLDDKEYQQTPLVSPVPVPDGKPNRKRKLLEMAIVQEKLCLLIQKSKAICVPNLKIAPAQPIGYRYSFNKTMLQLVAAKTRFHALQNQATAVRLANPYDLIGNASLLNRAAVKMANLCALFDLNTTRFADLCGGPGGFASFLLGKFNCPGFGLTLRGNQDYDSSIHPQFSISYGHDGTGNICNLQNINSFVDHVLANGGSVDLVVGDGGFSVIGDEINQEHHMKPLLLSQILTMFKILALSGTAVFKVFQILDNVTVQLVYLLYAHFESICILKPLSSRPTNCERYVIAKNLKKTPSNELITHLEHCVEQFTALKNTTQPPKSAHVTHQPGFVTLDEKIQLGLLDIEHVLDDTQMPDEFVEYLQEMNISYKNLMQCGNCPKKRARTSH
jgi:hypothetical protein